ncbi:hypothetical protein [Winogradskyella sp.]|uniref:hypothetical protein n=1 Tax=Winogradskyella sp. TaxID=1883156 RepID=UPI003BABA280
MKNFIIYFVIVILLTSCGKKPTFISVKDLKVESVRDSMMSIKMNYVVYNPNTIKSKLKESELKIYYQNTEVGEGFLNQEILLSPKDTIQIPLNFKVNIKRLSEFYPKLLSLDSSRFDVESNSKIETILKTFSIKGNEIVYLKVNDIVQSEIRNRIKNGGNFKIKGMTIDKIPSLNQSNFKINIQANNNFPFDYVLKEIDLNFYNSSTEIAKWQLGERFNLKANTSNTIPVSIVVNNLNVLKKAKPSWFTKQEIEFDMLGKAVILVNGYKFEVPIQDALKFDIKTLTKIFE